MKYIVFRNSKVLHILDKEPISVSQGTSVARCDYIPNLNVGEYHEVFNVQDHIETYTDKEEVEVVKTDELTGEEYTETEWVEVEKTRPYLTCELLVKKKEIKIPYEKLVEKYIREKYSISQELAILRQRDTKPQEFEEYFNYAEECKRRAKQ